MSAIDPGATSVWPARPEAARTEPGTVRRALLRAVPAVILAVLLGWLYEPWLGVLVLVAAAVLTTASALSPTAARWIEAVLGAVSHGVGRALSAVILTLVFVVLFVPVGVVSRLVRRDPLRTGVARPGTDWLERWGWRERRLPERSYASEQDLLGGRRSGRIAWAVGLATLLVLADAAIGTVLVAPPPEAGAPPPTPGQGEATAIPALPGPRLRARAVQRAVHGRSRPVRPLPRLAAAGLRRRVPGHRRR